MGRGNCCTFGKYEGLYYIDNDDLHCYLPTNSSDTEEPEAKLLREIPYEELDNWEFSASDTEFWMEDVVETLKSDLVAMFPSFSECDCWEEERHYILENRLFYIALVDNEWRIAVELIQKEDPYGLLEGLQKCHFGKYLSGIKKALFGQFDEIGAYGGAWTHKVLHKEEERYDRKS